MSATLDASPIAGYLGDARVLRSEGRQYPLEIEYMPHSAASLDQQVLAALARLPKKLEGHVLVFLPGIAEIRRTQTVCGTVAHNNGWLLLALHGDQSPDEQDRAVQPSSTPKVILSTNVAESSITIEGVNTVIDSGVARVAGHPPWSGLPTLEVARISQASAKQRAGRAGRTGPGRAIRLYPLEDFVRRPERDIPEISRADLAPMALLLEAIHAGPIDSLDWLDAPPSAAVQKAGELLDLIGARGEVGREMARYPLHPRLGRLIVESRRRGVAEEGCVVAALLSAGERLPARADHATRSDLLVLMESQWELRTAQLVRQVKRIVNPQRSEMRGNAAEDALLLSILAAFPDRVARRRQGTELQLASGGAAQLAPSSTVTAEYLVAVEAEDRRDQKAPLVRIASAIEPAWLIDLFPEQVRETSSVEWNRTAERVESRNALMFGDIAIDESRGTPNPEAAAALLAQKAVEAGIARFADPDEIEAFRARVLFASHHSAVPVLGPEAVESALRKAATGMKSFAELKNANLLGALERELNPQARKQLDDVAPERIRLPGGRQVRVNYETDQPPWIASRLQDFFGMRETPTVARGSVRVVVRLLAPNQRPVQMTSDLAGFWERLYPQVRKELSRRYPKHAWPESP